MHILFDFVSLQDDYVNGGNEYVFRVLQEVLKNKRIKISSLIDRKFSVPPKIQKIMQENFLDVIYTDELSDKNLEDKKIDALYIGIAQRFFNYDIEKLSVKIFITIHDVGDYSLVYDGNFNSKKRYEFEKKYVVEKKFFSMIKEILQRKYHLLTKENTIKKEYEKLSKIIEKKNVHIITVSEYTKVAVEYFFENIPNSISVFSAPYKNPCSDKSGHITNIQLSELIDSKDDYFIMLNCSRRNKNAALFLETWPVFLKKNDRKFKALLLGNIHLSEENIITIPYLNDSDLELALKNAYALVYPSVCEGYGYPPMEAMKYGTPVVCSNVTSLPEVYKNSVLYFSPFYPEDLFRALTKMTEEHEKYRKLSLEYYEILHKKQESDFQNLINFISCLDENL